MLQQMEGEARHVVEDVPGLDELAEAVLTLRTRDEAQRFLRDLCTLAELEALSHRWQIVRLLDEKLSYLEIAGRWEDHLIFALTREEWLSPSL